MNKLSEFWTKKRKYIFPSSIILNLILITFLAISLIKSKEQSKVFSETIGQTTKIENLEKSRMNGTVVLNEDEEKNYDELIGPKELSKLNLDKLSNLKYTKSTYDYRTTFDRFTAKTTEGIVITIEKIENNSPYLALYSPSEWLGVMSIKDLVAPVVTGYVNPELYNTKINGVNFSKHYSYYPGSVKLQYDTVVESNSTDHLYYLTFSSDWELEPDSKTVDPTQWYAQHPSEKFQILESFMKDITL